MNISIIDGSNYFKGLLLLIRKDRKLTVSEIMLMQKIGKKLGFEKEFCDNAINDIMENEYIEDTPPQFTSAELARKFITDGLSIAFSDRECHPSEESWLQSTAALNGVDEAWFRAAFERAATREHPPGPMEAEDITVQYS